MSVDERGITAQKIKTSPAMQHKCQGGSVKGEQATMKDPSAGSEHRDIETMERGEATVKNLQGRIFLEPREDTTFQFKRTCAWPEKSLRNSPKTQTNKTQRHVMRF